MNTSLLAQILLEPSNKTADILWNSGNLYGCLVDPRFSNIFQINPICY